MTSLLFPDDGRRHELIDGEHYVTPSPNTGTSGWSDASTPRSSSTCATIRTLGEAFLAPFDVVFSHFDIVEPDLLFVAAEPERHCHRPARARCAGHRDRDSVLGHTEG